MPSRNQCSQAVGYQGGEQGTDPIHGVPCGDSYRLFGPPVPLGGHETLLYQDLFRQELGGPTNKGKHPASKRPKKNRKAIMDENLASQSSSYVVRGVG
jgi:hypothetical protein